MPPKSQLCERAKEWASLRTDGELSELESALLDAHLGRCESCRTFAQGAENAATALRSAPLQRPVPIRIAPQRAARPVLRTLQIAAAVAVVVSAGVVAAVSVPSHPAAAKSVSMVAGLDSADGLRQLRRPGLIERGGVLPRNRLVPGEPI
jgi:ferric-dicitrate binding protein FerR (iron transport regulator)